MDSNQKILEQAIIQTAKAYEETIDAELETDLSVLRARRLQELKEKSKKKEQWLKLGHGELQEIEERQFFDIIKASELVVCHFFRENSLNCTILDGHLRELAKKHLGTKFVRINAEKSPFLTQKLKIWMLPTLVLVKKGIVEHQIVGFDELGGTTEFTIGTLEKRISKFGVIDPEEILEEEQKRSALKILRKDKTIQNGKSFYDSSDEED